MAIQPPFDACSSIELPQPLLIPPDPGPDARYVLRADNARQLTGFLGLSDDILTSAESQGYRGSFTAPRWAYLLQRSCSTLKLDTPARQRAVDALEGSEELRDALCSVWSVSDYKGLLAWVAWLAQEAVDESRPNP